jgi:hypothetical protein
VHANKQIRSVVYKGGKTHWALIRQVFESQLCSKRILNSSMRSLVLAAWCFCLFAAVSSQSVGTQAAEEPLNLPISVCTAPGNCQTEADAVVLDSNWRWAHTVRGKINLVLKNDNK